MTGCFWKTGHGKQHHLWQQINTWKHSQADLPSRQSTAKNDHPIFSRTNVQLSKNPLFPCLLGKPLSLLLRSPFVCVQIHTFSLLNACWVNLNSCSLNPHVCWQNPYFCWNPTPSFTPADAFFKLPLLDDTEPGIPWGRGTRSRTEWGILPHNCQWLRLGKIWENDIQNRVEVWKYTTNLQYACGSSHCNIHGPTKLAALAYHKKMMELTFKKWRVKRERLGIWTSQHGDLTWKMWRQVS